MQSPSNRSSEPGSRCPSSICRNETRKSAWDDHIAIQAKRNLVRCQVSGVRCGRPKACTIVAEGNALGGGFDETIRPVRGCSEIRFVKCGKLGGFKDFEKLGSVEVQGHLARNQVLEQFGLCGA